MSAWHQLRIEAADEDSKEDYAGRLRACIDYLAMDARSNGFAVTATVLETSARFVDDDLAAFKGRCW